MSEVPYLLGFYFSYLVGAFCLGWAFGWAVKLFKSFLSHGIKD